MRAGMPAFQEEVFGPVIFIYEVENEAEAIELANDSCYGLGGSVFSKNEARAEKVARQLETGMVYINHVTGTSPELPFNGTKCSGLGRELSPDGIYSFVNKKLIRVTSPDKPY
jgi:NAD-dependent aldehyde dehydrogenases